MNVIINSIPIQRTDIKQNWELKNPILLKGEFGIEIDTGVIKIGNGVSSWVELTPIVSLSISNEEIDSITI